MNDSPFAEFAAGAAIVREGEAARAMYIIESGRVEIRSSRWPQPLAELGPGQVLGEMALLQEQPHSATATAKTAVRALCIDQAAFFAVLRENPEVAVQLMRQLVLRLRAAEQRGQGPVPAAAAPAASAGATAAPGEAAVAAPATPTPTPTPARAPTQPTPAAATPAPAAAPAQQGTPAQAGSAPSTPAPARGTPVPPAVASTPTPTPAPPPPTPAATPPAPPAPPAAAAKPTPPASPPPAAAPGWSIRHGEGEIRMAVERDEWLIGRPDPATGQVPEIDLGALDVARSLSRRHARLRREGPQLVLREEPGVANGTWVNGERLAPGAAVPLKPGDRLRFGAVEVELVAR